MSKPAQPRSTWERHLKMPLLRESSHLGHAGISSVDAKSRKLTTRKSSHTYLVCKPTNTRHLSQHLFAISVADGIYPRRSTPFLNGQYCSMVVEIWLLLVSDDMQGYLSWINHQRSNMIKQVRLLTTPQCIQSR